MVIEQISLSGVDVSNALISLSSIVCDTFKIGMSVNLAELGSFRLVVPSKMMDIPEEVTVANALKTPKIVFTPKQKMHDATNSVELNIDQGSVKASSGTTPNLKRVEKARSDKTGIMVSVSYTRRTAAFNEFFNGVITIKIF